MTIKTLPELDAALARAANDMRVASAAHFWETFIKALTERTERLTTDMIHAPPEQLQVYQGRAREARALLDSLVNAPQLVREIEERKNAVSYPSSRSEHRTPARSA